MLLGHSEDQVVLGDAGVVDQDVQAAKVFNHLCYQVFCSVVVRGIRLVGHYLYVVGSKAFCNLLRLIRRTQISKRNVGTLLCQFFGDGGTYASAASGDNACFTR